MASVLIAIQARSSSKRLPGKSLELIDDATMVDHVLSAAKQSAAHLNKGAVATGIRAQACVLIPHHDPLLEALSGSCPIIEGPELNVLERFHLALKELQPDYVVRITGDCPLIIPTIITKHCLSAISLELDYCSNAYEGLRTFVDGYDCEVISSRALRWIIENATDVYDKEHVTTLLRREPPPWVKFGAVMGHVDLSDIKLSVDTLDDLKRVRENKSALTRKVEEARRRGYAIFRF